MDEGHSITLEATEDFDVIMMTGGADLSPSLYGEKIIPGTSINAARDLKEVGFISKKGSKRPKVGICRGGQLLNVLSGGRMWQDVDNHAIAGTHACKLEDLSVVQVTSTHHQMMIPGMGARILGTASLSTRKTSEAGSFKFKSNIGEDKEILWYNKTQSLCFQPHPEYGHKECRDTFFKFLYEFIWPVVQKNRIEEEHELKKVFKELEDDISEIFPNLVAMVSVN